MDITNRARKIMHELHLTTIRQHLLSAMRRAAIQATILGAAALLLWGLALANADPNVSAFLLLGAFGAICALMATAIFQINLALIMPKADT